MIAAVLAAALADRGPYIVAASSVSAEICWRRAGADSCKTVSGLKPDSEYSYAIPGSEKKWTARALPKADGTLRFAVFGDAGQGTKAQRRVAATLEKIAPQLVLVVGDIVYP